MTKPLPVFAMCLMLAGCPTLSGGGKGGAFCDVEKPPVLTSATIAAMSREEREAAVARIEYGEKECGWRPIR